MKPILQNIDSQTLLSIINTLLDGVLVCNMQEEIILANDSAQKMFMLSGFEINKMKVAELFPSPFHYEAFKKSFYYSGQIPYMETEFVRKIDQSKFSAELSLLTVLSPERKEPQYRIILIHNNETIMNLRALHSQKFDELTVDKVNVIFFKLEKIGPKPFLYDRLSFVEGNEATINFLIRFGVFATTAIGQGGSHNLGLYGPIPVGNFPDYLAIVYTFNMPNPHQDDPRYQKQDYCMISFIFPRSLEGFFTDRRRIRDEMRFFLNKFSLATEITLVELQKLKRALLFDTSEIPLEQRRLEYTLSAIYELNNQISNTITLEEALEIITIFVKKALHFTFFAVALVEELKQDIVFPSYLGYEVDSIDLRNLHVPLSSNKSIIATVIREKKQLNIGNLEEWRNQNKPYLAGKPSIKSELCVPILRSDGKALGAVNVESEDPNAFNESDVNIVVTLASTLANVITKHTTERKILAIFSLAKELTTFQSLTDVCNKALDFITQTLEIPIASINIIDWELETIDSVAAIGYKDNSQLLHLPLIGKGSITRSAVLSRQLINVKDVTVDERYIPVNSETKSELAIPISIGNKMIGVLNLESYIFDGFSDTKVRIIEMLANLLGSVLNQKELEFKLNSFTKLNQDLLLATNRVELFSNLTRFARNTLNYQIVSISSIDEINQIVKLEASIGYEKPEAFAAVPLSSNIGIVLHVALTGEIVLSNDVTKDTHYKKVMEGINSELAVPIFREKNRVWGVLNVESKIINRFTDTDVEIVKSMAIILSRSLYMIEEIERTIRLKEIEKLEDKQHF